MSAAPDHVCHQVVIITKQEDGLKSLDKSVTELESTIYGNGRPGLKERVQSIEQWRDSMILSKAQRYALWAAIAVTLIGNSGPILKAILEELTKVVK